MASTPVFKIEGKMHWRAAQDPESGYWVATCDMLGLNAGGETFEKLQECMAEVMEFLFVDLHEDGDLDEFLKEHGWEPDFTAPQPEIEVTELPALLVPV